jgi:hypothetical protein
MLAEVQCVHVIQEHFAVLSQRVYDNVSRSPDLITEGLRVLHPLSLVSSTLCELSLYSRLDFLHHSLGENNIPVVLLYKCFSVLDKSEAP